MIQNHAVIYQNIATLSFETWYKKMKVFFMETSQCRRGKIENVARHGLKLNSIDYRFIVSFYYF